MLEKYLKCSKVTDICRSEDNDIWVFFCTDETYISCYGLRVRCPFRISENDRIIVGATDMDDLPDEDMECETRFDAIIQDKVFPKFPLKVIAADFSEIGDFRIVLENGMKLEVFIQACTPDGVEDWRFIDCIRDEQYYFVDHLLKKAEEEEDYDDGFMHIWKMTYWRMFYDNKNVRSGLRLRCDSTLDSEVKRACKEFCAWLRTNYTFPIRVNIYLKDVDKVRALDGELVYGTCLHPYDRYKEPYIKIAAGDYKDLLLKTGRDNALAEYLFQMVHELTHYFQWVNLLPLTGEVEENQAERYSTMIVHEYAMIKEHP